MFFSSYFSDKFMKDIINALPGHSWRLEEWSIQLLSESVPLFCHHLKKHSITRELIDHITLSLLIKFKLSETDKA